MARKHAKKSNADLYDIVVGGYKLNLRDVMTLAADIANKSFEEIMEDEDEEPGYSYGVVAEEVRKKKRKGILGFEICDNCTQANEPQQLAENPSSDSGDDHELSHLESYHCILMTSFILKEKTDEGQVRWEGDWDFNGLKFLVGRGMNDWVARRKWVVLPPGDIPCLEEKYDVYDFSCFGIDD